MYKKLEVCLLTDNCFVASQHVYLSAKIYTAIPLYATTVSLYPISFNSASLHHLLVFNPPHLLPIIYCSFFFIIHHLKKKVKRTSWFIPCLLMFSLVAYLWTSLLIILYVNFVSHFDYLCSFLTWSTFKKIIHSWRNVSLTLISPPHHHHHQI